MSRRDDKTLLRDMIDAARSALSAIEGSGQATLAADHVRALGLVKCLEIVGMRQRLAHGYDWAAGRLFRSHVGDVLNTSTS